MVDALYSTNETVIKITLPEKGISMSACTYRHIPTKRTPFHLAEISTEKHGIPTGSMRRKYSIIRTCMKEVKQRMMCMHDKCCKQAIEPSLSVLR
ncbi:MAG: hypothetical protein U0264_04700 [Candidatus Kapaibacterium sp.]